MATKQIALQKIIRIGFALILLLLISNGAISFWIMHKMIDTSSWVTHTWQVKEKLDMQLGSLIDAETGQRGYLYTNKEEFLEPYRKALAEIQKDHDDLAELIKDNPAQVQRLKSIGDLIRQKLDEMAEVILLHNAGKKKEALDLVMMAKGKKFMDNIRGGVDEMDRAEDDMLAQREKDEKYFENLAQTFIASGTLLAAVICIFIFLYINRNVIRKFIIPVNEAVAAISTSATQIAATITQHERTASQQVTAASETSATITELSVSSRQSAEQAANAAAVAEKASTATLQGGETTHQAVAAMSGLKDKIAAMADQILRLGEQTGQIGGIATLVKDLSGEINMLALNAAVEAARAGEHGKGFAVVAGEVRKLAGQSKKSAEQASALVADIQKATNSSIMMTEEGTRTVNEVTQLAQKVAELFNNLSGMAGSVNENAQQVMLNAKQQSAAFTQIVEATNSIAAGAKETAAGISQTKIGVQKLNETAENLKAIA